MLNNDDNVIHPMATLVNFKSTGLWATIKGMRWNMGDGLFSTVAWVSAARGRRPNSPPPYQIRRPSLSNSPPLYQFRRTLFMY